MDKEFANKVLLVTGATSGIGHATALRFAEAGASIAAVGRDETALRDLKKDLGVAGVPFRAIRADLSREEDVDTAVSETIKQLGGIDVLVNAAGHISNGTIENTSPEAWDAMLGINLRTPFLLMQKALPAIIERRGNIVNVSSVTGLRVSGCAGLLRFQGRFGSTNSLRRVGTGWKRRARECCQSGRRGD